MKRQLYFFIILLIASTFSSCEKMDDTYKEFIIPDGIIYPGKATDPLAYPGKNRAKLVWLKGTDPKVTEAKIFWNNYTDSILVPMPKGQDTVSCIVGPLEENTYTFIIKTYDEEGNISVPVEVNGKSYGYTYQSGLFNRMKNNEVMTGSDGAWTIYWETADKGAIATEIEYKTSDGMVKTEVPVTDNEIVIKSAIIGTTYRYRTSYMPDTLSIDTFFSGYTEGIVPEPSPELVEKSGWIVTASSNAADTQAPNGGPERTIDGDITTFWHTQHKPSSPGYPHWLAFDMGRDVKVFYIELTPRDKYPEQSFKGFIIQGSEDGITWTDYGSFTLDPVASKTQAFTLEGSPVTMRHIRIFMNVPGTTIHAHLAEFNVYGF